MASPLNISQKVLKLICSCQLSTMLTGPATPAFTISSSCKMSFSRSSAGLGLSSWSPVCSQRHPGSTSKSHSRTHKALLLDVLNSEIPPGAT